MGPAVLVPVLALGGVVAGAVGTAGGITSLVAYPLLLAVGMPPLTANTTGSVAMLGSGVGSASRAGPELVGQRRTLLRLAPMAIGGALGGAVLLLTTPAGVFARVVPFLVATGAVLLLLEPKLRARRTSRGVPAGATAAAVLAVAVYDGYFGAGSGVLLIAVLMLTVESRLLVANAVKNVLLVSADLLPAVLFALFGHVAWWAALPLGLGTLAGGLIGPGLARLLPRQALRMLIAVSGLVLAGWLLLTG